MDISEIIARLTKSGCLATWQGSRLVVSGVRTYAAYKMLRDNQRHIYNVALARKVFKEPMVPVDVGDKKGCYVCVHHRQYFCLYSEGFKQPASCYANGCDKFELNKHIYL